MKNLDHALTYALKMNWKVFPCKRDKTPLTVNGFKNASSDQGQVTEMWQEHPEASIGLPTGPDNGVWVLDIDLKSGGFESLAKLEEQHGPLPETLKQKTGGGGAQYVWKWNGREIRNSAGKIAPGIDVRGNGGYVILPPSGHPSGGTYEWLTKKTPIEAPDWLAELAAKKEEAAPQSRVPGMSSKYGEAALARELVKLSSAVEGSRNQTLNECAYSIGQLVAGGELNGLQAETALYGVAVSIGLQGKESRNTIRSAFQGAASAPRTAPESNTAGVSRVSEGKQCKHSEAGSKQEVSTDGNLVSRVSTDDPDNRHTSDQSLSYLIEEWIKNSTGSFTVEQIDREFCLKSRAEKNNRSKILSIYKDKKLIKKDKTIKGKWHVIDSDVQWVDLNKADEAAFPISLPFGLHEKIAIPRRSIIVLAGSTNAGKTAFILNTLRLNINTAYEKIYCMSEMQDGEYKDRVLSFGDPIDLWNRNIKAASKSYDFDGLIQHYNPNGLTCIDYLEEIDGEYFKIPSSIRDIYDSLENGVAVIAIQKKGIADVGRGGEATKDKARLYMTLDFLCSMEHCIICAIRLTKVKKSLKENMQDRELHFRIERGSHLSVIMDWTPSSKVNRQKCIQQYTTGSSDAYIGYRFLTKEGDEVELKEHDYNAWKRKYEAFDLDRELNRISEMSYAAPWMKKKGWFFQLGGYLDKKENEDRR